MKRWQKTCFVIAVYLNLAGLLTAREFHVSPSGDNKNIGSIAAKLKTISAAANHAKPGDTITVHQGVYRERINPPRGGSSNEKRITYQVAKGETATIKGSEIITGWEKIKGDTWKVEIPNSFFGKFNPYSDLIRGDWFNPLGRKHHTGAVYLNEKWMMEAARKSQVVAPIHNKPLWFAEVNKTTTTIWAQFKGINPNTAKVEINVRQTVFYPKFTGINYITVRGFIMKDAATPWAPPTAEQIGLIGTHWSKGWIIEDNEISYSKCVGITLGKHGDKFDNTSANTAVGYIKTIERAISMGWSKENIGSHVVRNNHIHDCEQCGIAGSLGPIFCSITGNEINNIHIHRLFTGEELAGIKFHAPIDTEIKDNHIHHCWRGIWLDWMTQGTRVSGNLLNNNEPRADLMVEVNHGPFLVDNNLFLSKWSIYDRAEGGAYVHNIFAGTIALYNALNRKSPYHPAHSTKLAGTVVTKGGDNRFYNNIFINKANLSIYNSSILPMFMAGNVYTQGTKVAKMDHDSLQKLDYRSVAKLLKKSDGWYLGLSVDPRWKYEANREIITTKRLGLSLISKLPYENIDGSPYCIDKDYFGKPMDSKNPNAGPFSEATKEHSLIKVWPKE